ncbi:MAG: type 4a pilus biogenesis protein PilO [Deltaproteobacteria bacterium]|nr:type 4a pilus biogenesis protein PilO [Deltaproteobacteria bacterium]
MDKFLELPLPQRLLLTGVIIAVLGGGFYYLLLSPMSDEIDTATRRYTAKLGEYNKLKEFENPQFQIKMEQEKRENLKKQAAFREMLPTEEQIPSLIKSIKADADSSGLNIIKFDPVKERVNADYYARVPVRMEVMGTFFQFINFLQGIAAPQKRIVTVRDIEIDTVSVSADYVLSTIGTTGALRILKEKEQARGLSPAEKYFKALLLFEEQSKSAIVNAKFKTHAIIYTGVSESGAAK